MGMHKTASNPPLLDERLADFITHHVSINVASCSPERVPSLARALGCRVSVDRRKVTLFLSVSRSVALLRDLRAGGGLAVVFSRPTTHETLQLKGARGSIVSLEDDDHTLMQRYGDSLIEDIRQLGYKDPFTSALVAAIGDEPVGVAFTPTSAFVQTPGPKAGRHLEPKP